MYLPSTLIRDSLNSFGIAHPGDPIYVSGEIGASKYSGRLFDHVLAEDRLLPSELLHCGDDSITDDSVPARRGIAVRPLTIGKLNRFEVETLRRTPAPRIARGHLGGVARAVRAAAAREDEPAAQYAALAAYVIGPLFAGFVHWVLQSARADGVEKLYFVSRDAQILLKVAGEIEGPGDPNAANCGSGAGRVEGRRWLRGPRLARGFSGHVSASHPCCARGDELARRRSHAFEWLVGRREATGRPRDPRRPRPSLWLESARRGLVYQLRRLEPHEPVAQGAQHRLHARDAEAIRAHVLER